jgi:hypothetical protein
LILVPADTCSNLARNYPLGRTLDTAIVTYRQYDDSKGWYETTGYRESDDNPHWDPSAQKEAALTADPTGHVLLPDEPDPSLAELLRAAGSRPVENIHALAVEGFFESDEELQEFLRFYHGQRESSVS